MTDPDDHEREDADADGDVDVDVETIPVVAVVHPPRRGEKQLATRGHGWPSELPTLDGHDSWTDAMDRMESVSDLTDAQNNEQVGELDVDVDTREIRDWTVYEDYRVEDVDQDGDCDG